MDSYNKRLFTFNLIPPKSKKEIETLQERDRSTLYSFLLIFFAVLLFFGLTILNNIVIEPRINSLEDDLDQQDTQITTFQSARELNGEVFIKSEAIAPVLELDIGTIELLETSERIIEGVPNAQISSYGREPSGEFVLTIILDSYEDSTLIIENAKTQENISEVFQRIVSVNNNNGKITSIIGFTIINEDLLANGS